MGEEHVEFKDTALCGEGRRRVFKYSHLALAKVRDVANHSC